MTLIAIPGAANANSYVTVAEAVAYFANRLNTTAWDDAVVAGTDEAALIQATFRLDQYDYVGEPCTDTQALKWPRQLEDGSSIRNYDGEAQIETAIIVGTVTGDGTATVIVTADGMTGSPITLNVDVLTNDDDATVATKIRADLNADVNITGFFTISGTGAAIVLTRTEAAENDPTMNLAYDNGTCTGLTADPTSTDTLPGSIKMVPPPIKYAQLELALALLAAGGEAIAAGTVESLKIGKSVEVKYAAGSTGEVVDLSVDSSGLAIQAARFLKGLRIVNVLV